LFIRISSKEIWRIYARSVGCFGLGRKKVWFVRGANDPVDPFSDRFVCFAGVAFGEWFFGGHGGVIWDFGGGGQWG
jgi:hypothetical protein